MKESRIKFCKSCHYTKELSKFRHNRAICLSCETNKDRLRRGEMAHTKHKEYRIKTIHSYTIPSSKTLTMHPLDIDANGRVRNIGLKKCGECGHSFYGNKTKMTCSKKCSRKRSSRITRNRRKALIKNVTVETVNSIVVFHKYDWHCAVCRVHTPYELLGKNKPNSPELDHIIPLSKGGEHSYQNTQLLCRKCNNLKSDKI